MHRVENDATLVPLQLSIRQNNTNAKFNISRSIERGCHAKLDELAFSRIPSQGMAVSLPADGLMNSFFC